MYVVRRPFKNFGKTLVAGDIIENPATIKRFKNKLAEGKILEVTDENKDYYATYFQCKFGVNLDVTEGTKKPIEETKPTTQAKPVKQVKPTEVKVVTAQITH